MGNYISIMSQRNSVSYHPSVIWICLTWGISLPPLLLLIMLLLLLLFSFIFISWRLITLQYCSGFLPYIDMYHPWIYMCSPSLSRSILLPPSLSHPSRSSQCTSAEHLSYASKLGWWSVSLLTVYLFQCYSFRSSHSRLLPQSPKFCSVHLCIFLFCIWGYRYHLFKFHIYALVYCIGL